jgi:hypothetical protein
MEKVILKIRTPEEDGFVQNTLLSRRPKPSFDLRLREILRDHKIDCWGYWKD